MTVLAIWDISARHYEFKDQMRARGYRDHITDDEGTKIGLTNTTMWKDAGSPEQACDDMQLVAASLRIVLEKSFAAYFGSWVASQQKPEASIQSAMTRLLATLAASPAPRSSVDSAFVAAVTAMLALKSRPLDS